MPDSVATPKLNDLHNESDVEQKLLYPMLAGVSPEGLGYGADEILTKSTLKIETIEKGKKKKHYVPDYLVISEGLPFLVIEAKHPSEGLVEASREARLYALEVNSRYPNGVNPCKYCLVSNGEKTEVRSSDSDDIIVSVDFEEMVTCCDSYLCLFDLLNKIESVKILSDDVEGLSPSRFYRPLSQVGGSTSQNERRAENSFGLILSREFRSILNPIELEDRINIVKNAYVRSKRKERYIEDIDKLIRAATPPEIRALDAVSDTSSPAEIIARFNKLKNLHNQILLLVGNVGAGKSTFVDYLQEVALPEDVANRTEWLRLDLNDSPQNKEEIYRWVKTSLIDQFLKIPNNIDLESLTGLVKIFSTEVEKFKKGPGALLTADEATYNLKLYELLVSCVQDDMRYLQCLERYFCRNRGKLLVVVLDNCDRRDRDMQLLMFEVARWIQSELRTLVILPLRDTTYELHRDQPPLDAALKDLTFRIEPPLFQSVLKKRIDLILKDLEGSNDDLEYWVDGIKVVFKKSKLAEFLKGMLSSLFENERFARRMITGLAGWDMRKAMEIFIDLCRSGYIDEGRILANQVSGDSFKLSEDIVLNVLMRTHRMYYDGENSRIKNIFQIDRLSRRPCHFIRFWILLWLYERYKVEGPSGVRGFHLTRELISFMVKIGLDRSDVEREIAYLEKSSCLISESQNDLFVDENELLGLTPAGHVHVHLSKKIGYLFGCAEDTNITNDDVSDRVLKSMRKHRYSGKITWTETNQVGGLFAEYLQTEEDHWRSSQLVSDDIPALPPSFSAIGKQAEEEINRIQERFKNRGNGNAHSRSKNE